MSSRNRITIEYLFVSRSHLFDHFLICFLVFLNKQTTIPVDITIGYEKQQACQYFGDLTNSVCLSAVRQRAATALGITRLHRGACTVTMSSYVRGGGISLLPLSLSVFISAFIYFICIYCSFSLSLFVNVFLL
jgi:hypothetical protein